jgi:flagellar motility protein MotE (MotC chaperone)
MKKWFFPILVFLIAVATSVTVLEVAGVLNLRQGMLQRFRAHETIGPLIRTYELGQAQSENLLLEQSRLEEWEQSLQEEEAELQIQRTLLDRQKTDLERQKIDLQNLIDQWDQRQALDRTTQEQNQRREMLGDLYANMRPEEAARVLVQLDQELIVTILEGLPPEQGANILAALEPKFAAQISKLIAQ